MKLRNKKTGEIGWLYCDHIGNPKKMTVFLNDNDLSAEHWDYSTLAELNEEWEDYHEEPEFGFIIDLMEEDYISADDSGYTGTDVERAKELGLWFETEEEAERAVEKLKAWKRLKDKGLHVTTFYVEDGSLVIRAKTHNSSGAENWDDLDLLFSEEEE